MKKTLIICLAVVLAGCASMNAALTPSVSVSKDSFDGSTTVLQKSVSSSSSLSEAWHTLGFDWNQKTPDIVYITAGVSGIVNITNVIFNADGYLVDKIEPASVITEYGSWSERRFAISWDDFLIIANANSVKMKVVRINNYTVSSFGPSHPGAIVDLKIPPFISEVKKLKSIQEIYK